LDPRVRVALPLSSGPDREPERGIAPPEPARERRLSMWVGAGTATTVVVLIGLLVVSIRTGAAVERRGAGAEVELEVIGHQWWWEVRYLGGLVITANEIHIPTQRPVRIHLSSQDVIHSFWAPSLHGKTDLIPGKRNTIVIQADRPGVYRGQCAEFCGLAHAKMAFLVVAEDRAAFYAWLEAQRRPAAEPTSDAGRRGRDVFLRSPCTSCHAIRGTAASATNAPDLTHFGSRMGLAAGTVPNARGHVAGWIANPERVKPGAHMPPTTLEPEDLDALAAYLGELR
jgi:cytochrome c oxidase subunit 2